MIAGEFGTRESPEFADPPSHCFAESAEPPRADWMAKLRSGLKKTGSTIALAFTGAQVGDELYEDLETALLQADAGIERPSTCSTTCGGA